MPKIKLKWGTVVAEPSFSYNGSTMQRTGYKFITALEKLCRDPLPMRERFAAGKTLKELKEFLGIYERDLTGFLNELGTKRSAVLKRELERLQQTIEALPPDANKKIRDGLVMKQKTMADELKQLTSEPHLDVMTIPPHEVDKMEEFNRRDMALRAEEFELQYLDHKIPVSDETRLDGDELAAIEDIIEVAAKTA